MLLVVWLFCEGLWVEVVYNEWLIVCCFVLLCKIFVVDFCGFGVVLVVYGNDGSIFVVVLFGIVVVVLYVVVFGIDFLFDKWVEGIDYF